MLVGLVCASGGARHSGNDGARGDGCGTWWRNRWRRQGRRWRRRGRRSGTGIRIRLRRLRWRGERRRWLWLTDATWQGIRDENEGAHAHAQLDTARFAIGRPLVLRLELAPLHVAGATGQQRRCKNTRYSCPISPIHLRPSVAEAPRTLARFAAAEHPHGPANGQGRSMIAVEAHWRAAARRKPTGVAHGWS